MFDEDSTLLIKAEPLITDGNIRNGGKKMRVELEKVSDYDRENLTYDMPVEEYDDKMTEIMIEMFYARNKADLLAKGIDNPHEKSKEKVKDVMSTMMKEVSNGFDPDVVDEVIDRKRTSATENTEGV